MIPPNLPMMDAGGGTPDLGLNGVKLGSWNRPVEFDDVTVVSGTAVVLNDLFETVCSDWQRDSIFTKGPSDVLDHATSEIASGGKLGIDATKKIPGEGFKRSWPPLVRMDENVRKKIDALFGGKP